MDVFEAKVAAEEMSPAKELVQKSFKDSARSGERCYERSLNERTGI